MYSPTTRLLTVLEVLQSKASVTGPELAKKLEVDVRSVRRYITMLRDMGIPVESEPGRYGIYYLRPGFRLPPLMFTGGEILAIMLGLVAVRHLGLSHTLAVGSAVAKIERVLPHELRERAQALQEVLTLNLPISQALTEEVIAKVSLAAYQHNQLWIVYQNNERDKTERLVDVYGLVYQNGLWYSVGYCHLRRDVRIFRLDRIQQISLLETQFEPPADFDPLAYLLAKIAAIPDVWLVEVLLKTNLPYAQARISPAMGILEVTDKGVRLRMRADGLEWAARFLASLGCPLIIIQPPELREALKKLAQAIFEMSEAQDEC